MGWKPEPVMYICAEMLYFRFRYNQLADFFEKYLS